ncbi:2-isopropylmalate synthase [Candidatus Woesearchaeota archaeon]|nr:2-isopropylmalate synthase [Candidatus Woesearchaeota archaeon]
MIIFDTTLRDGEQSPGASLTIREKILIAKQLARLNVDVIEAGFPIASSGDFQAVKQIAQNVQGPIICGLARAMNKDIDQCWEAIRNSKKPRIHTFIATSQIHLEQKLRKSKEQVIQMTVDAVKYAKRYCSDIEFSPEDASRTDIDYMCDVIRAAIRAGATTINIPDTVGYAVPEEFGRRIKYVKDKIPETEGVILSVHCHNDLGNAVANSLAGVKNGATQVECCINGIGERAGNAATEEIIMNLATRGEYYKTKLNINLKELYNTSRLVSNLTGIDVQRNKAIVGKNAFAHESGIHQHGIIQNRETYEIMRPEDVGWVGENLVIGKHSGRHAITNILRETGYEFNDGQIEQITNKVKELADKEKSIEKDDVIAIANDITHQLTDDETIVRMIEMSVMTGNITTPTASVKLQIEGKTKIGTGVGVGPVDAVSNAIKNTIQDVMGKKLRLAEYNLKAITGGTDALARVAIKMEDENGNIFRADGVNEDVIRASANALIKGINKAISYNENINKPTSDKDIHDKIICGNDVQVSK